MTEKVFYLPEKGRKILLKLVKQNNLSEDLTVNTRDDWEKVTRQFNTFNFMNTRFKAIELKKLWDLHQRREKSKVTKVVSSCSVKLEPGDETEQRTPAAPEVNVPRSGPLRDCKVTSIQDAGMSQPGPHPEMEHLQMVVASDDCATTSSNLDDAPPNLGLPFSCPTDFLSAPFSMKLLKGKAAGSSTSTEVSEDEDEEQWAGWPEQLTEERMRIKAMNRKMKQELRHSEELHCQKLRHKDEMHQLQLSMQKERHQALMKKENSASCY